LVKAIEANPVGIIESLNKAARKAQEGMAEKQRLEEEKARAEEFKNPRKPVIDGTRAMRGKPDAAITIVEYSDFECPYCSRGYATLREVEKKYGDQVRVIYKHMPLEFHKNAMPAAQYFEAIAMQDAQKAYLFHDKIFENQAKLKDADAAYFESVAKDVGADVAKVKAVVNSQAVKDRIAADIAEAKSFEIQGTPAFLINGVALKGAYPAAEFDKIIDKWLAQAKK